MNTSSSTAFTINKPEVLRILKTAGWVGLSAALTYLIGQDLSAFGALSPIVATLGALAINILTRWALPSPTPSTPKLEAKIGEVVKAAEKEVVK